VDKRVICISHATGAAGDEVARRVAKRLRFRYLDEELVGRAAALGHVSPEALLDAESRIRGWEAAAPSPHPENAGEANGSAGRGQAP